MSELSVKNGGAETNSPGAKNAAEQSASDDFGKHTDDVKRRFGVLPNFFNLTPATPEITANLWGYAQFAYLDNPLPSLFKERLFVYLSRFCEARYCIARHVGFLIGLGRPSGDATAPVQSFEEVIRLVRFALPRGEGLKPCIELCASESSAGAEMPEPESLLEKAIFACASNVFLQTAEASDCLAALRNTFGDDRFHHLLVFLDFIRTAHFWTKVNVELDFEDDIKQLLATHEQLAECLLNDPESSACAISSRMMDELASLRREATARDAAMRTQRIESESRLYEVNAQLLRRIAEQGDSRRAALNLMEDAVLDRRRIEESETRFRAAFEQANVGIVQASPDGRLLVVNPGFCKIIGYPEEETRGMLTRDITHPDDYEKEEELTRRLVAGEIPGYTLEKRFLRKDGRLVWGQMTATLVRRDSGEPYYMLSIVEDISERKRAEDALKQLNEELEGRVAERTVELMETNASLQAEIAERLRAELGRSQVLRRLVMAQEDERRRIAREMHDQFGQQLTVLILKLGLLKEDCGERIELCEQVETLEAVASQLDADVDFLVWELRPTALDDLGLQDALTSYAQNWSKHFGVSVEVDARGVGKGRLTSETEIVLYRIAQEALNNVAKHARAANVSVLLEGRADAVSLIVEDDGVGFDDEHGPGASDKGLGLVGMRERAALVGGTAEVESQPGEGTRVIVRIPAPPRAQEGKADE